MNTKIITFDTSLRDGAQTAGVNIKPQTKIDIAKKLDVLGIDKIEAGFPTSSKGDFGAVKTIGETVNAQVYGLAMLTKPSIEDTYNALRESKNRGIHTFIGTSPMHREYKLKKSKKEILQEIAEKVAYARKLFKKDIDSIMFSPEDGLRTEIDFLFETIETAIKAGATEINLPDTVGFSQYMEIYDLVKDLTEYFKETSFSIHTHNDLGQAVANTLAAVKAGCSIIQGTIPPAYGERAGNADLIQVLMNIIKRPDYYNKELNPNLDMTKAYDTVSFISNSIGKRIPDNYPILGGDVYRHSSGIHQDGANKNKSTYEIIQPEEIGYKIEQSFILTNQSGRVGLENAIKSYFGLELDKEKLSEIFNKFKEITSANSNSIVVTMDDIREILIDSGIKLNRKIKTNNYFINLDINNKAKATIELNVDGETKTAIASGVGPVDAIYKAILKASDIKGVKLIDFNISALRSQTSAEAKIYIKIEKSGRIYEEYGIDQDIVKASIKAFVNCLDRI